MAFVTLWLRAFGLTVLIEAPFIIALFRQAEPRIGRRVAFAFFANLASHPAVWFIFPVLLPRAGLPLVIQEVWAVLIEALFYRLVFDRGGGTLALGGSALANGASYGAGLVVRALTGWI